MVVSKEVCESASDLLVGNDAWDPKNLVGAIAVTWFRMDHSLRSQG